MSASPPPDNLGENAAPVSRFTGVSWDKARQKWRATQDTGGDYKTVGRFDNDVEAARAYDDAARAALGDFARLNFPTPEERKRSAAFVDRHEARRMFDISLPTWKRWEDAGIICGIKTSYRVFYRVEELQRLLPEFGPVEPPYPDPKRPGVFRVPLTKRGWNRKNGEAIIDADALPLVDGKHCYWSNPEGLNGGYVAVFCPPGGAPLHRMILGIDDPNLHIGHANGDPMDCRRANLVVRTIQERTWTCRKRATNHGRPCISRFKGVSWIEREQLWKVRITVDGKENYLGRFREEIDAAEAYDEAAREFFGEHAWLNFPNKGERGLVGAMSSRAAA